MKRSRMLTCALVAATAVGLVAAVTGIAQARTGDSVQATSALGSNWHALAPYLMPQSDNPPDRSP